jgi:hypothetical protein
MTARTLQRGRPATIHDPKLGAPFVAEAAILENGGWLTARGRVRRKQAGELVDLAGPVVERSWSPATPIRVEWKAARR